MSKEIDSIEMARGTAEDIIEIFGIEEGSEEWYEVMDLFGECEEERELRLGE